MLFIISKESKALDYIATSIIGNDHTSYVCFGSPSILIMLEFLIVKKRMDVKVINVTASIKHNKAKINNVI